MLVEDNETNRFVAREMLAACGCDVEEACDGEEGVAAASRRRFDLILMDLSMPKLDGMGATRRIRGEAGPSQAAPIVGLTAHALPEEQEQLRRAGMQDCLVKPLRSGRLGALLQQISRDAEAGDAVAPEAAAHAGAIDQDVVGELVEIMPGQMLRQKLAAFQRELDAARDQFRNPQGVGDVHAIGRLAHRYAAPPRCSAPPATARRCCAWKTVAVRATYRASRPCARM